MEPETDFLGDVLRLALGIALGGILVWAAIQYYDRYSAAQAVAAAETSVQRLLAETAASAAKQDRQRRAVERLNAEQATRAAAARAAREAEDRRREDAWKAFYQPSPECSSTTSIECGNAHIRARREFEQRDAAGQL